MQEVHISDVNLNLLVALDALLAERSVTRAAARLGLTQSATSHALARLRELFGDPLLVRGSAGMMPTPRAEELAGPVRQGLLQLQRAVRGELSFDPARSTRTFSIATVDHPQITGLPRFLELAAAEAPGIALTVLPLGPDLARRLEEGALDVVLAGAEAEALLALDSGLMRSLIVSEDFVSVLRADHPVAMRETLDLETFAGLSHLLVSTTGTGGGIVDAALAAQGLERRIAVRVPHFASAPHLLARADLIATLPRAIAEAAARVTPLRLFRPPLELPRSDAYLWWHARVRQDPAHVWFRQALLRAFAPYRG